MQHRLSDTSVVRLEDLVNEVALCVNKSLLEWFCMGFHSLLRLAQFLFETGLYSSVHICIYTFLCTTGMMGRGLNDGGYVRASTIDFVSSSRT